MKHFSKQKGISIYIAIMIIAVLLAIVLSAGAILLGQLKMIKGMENSIAAFYAADSGIEKALMDRTNPPPFYSETLDSGASYEITAVAAPPPDNFYIRSVGKYKGTKRAIEVVY